MCDPFVIILIALILLRYLPGSARANGAAALLDVPCGQLLDMEMLSASKHHPRKTPTHAVAMASGALWARNFGHNNLGRLLPNALDLLGRVGLPAASFGAPPQRQGAPSAEQDCRLALEAKF